MNRPTCLLISVCVIGSLTLVACEDKKPASAPAGNAGTTAKPVAPASGGHDGHDHAAGGGDKHDHDHDHGDGHGDEGPETDLGSATIGGFQVKAARLGDFKAGKDAPVEVEVAAAAGSTAKVAAVRAWFGTQDARGSIKAKVEMEKGHGHAHVEIPDPLPAGAKLWVEIEDDKGAKATGSFDLKA